jgi:hypothetical protein
MSVFGWLVLLALVPVLLDGNANGFDALSPVTDIVPACGLYFVRFVVVLPLSQDLMKMIQLWLHPC